MGEYRKPSGMDAGRTWKQDSAQFDAALKDWNERTPEDWRRSDADATGHDDGYLFDTDKLMSLANARMPFGKYAGRLLIDLPEGYVLWFAHKGFPKGEIGRQLESLLVVTQNGMEPLLRPLVTESC